MTGNPQLPERLDLREKLFYGKIQAAPRDVIYGVRMPVGNSLADEDTRRKSTPAKSAVTWKEIAAEAQVMPQEKDGVLQLHLACTMAQTPYAYTENGDWEYCSSESFLRSGIAMQIRKPGIVFTEKFPSLCCQFACTGGKYQIWLLMLCKGQKDSHFFLEIDGEKIPEEKLYHGAGIWRYSAEQTWRWIPVLEAELTKGNHVLKIGTMRSGIRFDRIYMTKGPELPPADLGEAIR